MAVARDRVQHESLPALIQESPVINFKTVTNHGYEHPNGSSASNLLSFEHYKPQLDDYSMWEDTDESSRLFDDFSSKDTAQEGAFSWLYSDSTLSPSDCILNPEEPSFKRPLLGENSNMAAMKKQCTTKSKQRANKITNATLASSKDPQSIAAKNRRERISERLKTLQELVPNGTKVDLVTMLEKAISYVKFLQLQVKVLATDEFWPVQGGKAPDIAQVKEAIDAILSSQRDSRNSSSSSKS